jgi:hypothetical protein
MLLKTAAKSQHSIEQLITSVSSALLEASRSAQAPAKDLHSLLAIFQIAAVI